MLKKIMKELKYWGQIFLLPIYWFSYITPRSRRIWLFGSSFGKRFADNPRYMYLYLNQKKHSKIKAIWITHDKKIEHFLKQRHLRCYYYHSLKGIWYCLRGGVYIFDNYSKDISFWLSGGAIKVNLWHGTGNKRINHDNEFDELRHPKNKWESTKNIFLTMSNEKPSHYILATSEKMGDIFSSAFCVPRNHIIVNNYPRNDTLFTKEYKLVYTQEEMENVKNIKSWKNQGNRIDFYMPTFRKSEKDFFRIMDIEVFNEFLKEHHIIFLTKLHPKSQLKNEFERISASNIVNVSADIDPYTFLKYVDILTTDYSSIYSDYMLLGRPVVAFQYDYKEYSSDTRGQYFDFDEYMPEEKATTMQELMEKTELVLQKDSCKEERKISCDQMFSTQNGHASSGITKKIIMLCKYGRLE